jgi:glyoxalase family protein
MSPAPIRSLHHVTATVDVAQDDLDFFAGRLGLRLVKKTVNFDNPGVYHFYYGDELGAPGTIWTTFPYHGKGVRTGVIGAGQVTATAFSVLPEALEYWTGRLRPHGVATRAARFDEPALRVRDPSGLEIDLVAPAADPRVPWAAGGVPVEHAVRGLHHVELTVHRPEATVLLLTELLGFRIRAEEGDVTRLGVGGGAPGTLVEVIADPRAERGINGLGTVHHVAFAIEGDEAQLALREELLSRGLQVTPVMDRQYFKSIYFREPGGVLFEVATMAPGFAVDEEPARLGHELMLPPWEEPRRAAIEAALPPLAAAR